MQIQRIQQNQTPKTSFKSWAREVLKPNNRTNIKEILYRNDTWFFRDNRNWEKFVEFLTNRYKNVPKVNTYCYGCSDGSDPYSFMMAFFTFMGENAKKFMPFVGIDIDALAIKKANEEEILLSHDDPERINRNTNNNINRFLTYTYGNTYIPKPILKDNIIFREGDIRKEYKKIKKDNSIVMARNFWPYLPVRDRVMLAQNLHKHLDSSSLLVLGEYDLMEYDYSLFKILFNAGFKTTDIFGVFEKEQPSKFRFSFR